MLMLMFADQLHARLIFCQRDVILPGQCILPRFECKDCCRQSSGIFRFFRKPNSAELSNPRYRGVLGVTCPITHTVAHCWVLRTRLAQPLGVSRQTFDLQSSTKTPDFTFVEKGHPPAGFSGKSSNRPLLNDVAKRTS